MNILFICNFNLYSSCTFAIVRSLLTLIILESIFKKIALQFNPFLYLTSSSKAKK